MILKVFSKLNNYLILTTVVSPTIPTVPWQSAALLSPSEDCQIFVILSNSSPILSHHVKHRGSLPLKTAPETASTGDWGRDPSLCGAAAARGMLDRMTHV